MFSADVGVVESVCFFTSKSEDLLSAWGEVVHESLGLGVSMDSFASFQSMGVAPVVGLNGMIRQLLGIDRPQVA